MLRKHVAALAALLLLLLVVLAVAPVRGAGAGHGDMVGDGAVLPRLVRGTDKLLEPLAARLRKAAPEEAFDVVVQLAPELDTTTSVSALAQTAGAFAVRASWQRALHGFSARLSVRQIEALRRSPLVLQIDPDLQVSANLDTSTQYTGARQARADFRIDGSLTDGAVAVAIIDTGIDAGHPDLKGKVVGWDDEIGHKAAPYDDNGHGTHVASIATGTGDGSGGKYAGNAPGAALVGIKVLSGAGSGSISGIISGIDWMLNHASDYNIKVAKATFAKVTPLGLS